MSYEILAAIDPEIKIGTFVILLIEEKIGVGFAGVYPDKRGARCVNVAREMFHATAPRTRNASYNRAGRVSRITWCHYHFPEIKSSEVQNS
jgi:hypothetical protein